MNNPRPVEIATDCIECNSFLCVIIFLKKNFFLASSSVENGQTTVFQIEYLKQA